jgi:hypothetical protein
MAANTAAAASNFHGRIADRYQITAAGARPLLFAGAVYRRVFLGLKSLQISRVEIGPRALCRVVVVVARNPLRRTREGVEDRDGSP